MRGRRRDGSRRAKHTQKEQRGTGQIYRLIHDPVPAQCLLAESRKDADGKQSHLTVAVESKVLLLDSVRACVRAC